MPGKIQVVLTIAIENTLSEERDDLFLLSSDLQEDDVPIEQDFGSGTWWSEESSEVALSSFMNFGLLWFDKYSNLSNLRHYFEFVLENGIPSISVKMPAFLTRMSGPETVSQGRKPPIYRKFAALVCMLQGDIGAALHYAEEYLKGIPTIDDITWQKEREETLKQIKLLSSKS